MRRRRRDEPEAELPLRATNAEHAAAFLASLGPEPRRRGTSPRQACERATKESETMRASNDWSRAEPRHLVAIYAFFHAEVYGVEPKELFVGPAWNAASSAAAKLLRDEFEWRQDAGPGAGADERAALDAARSEAFARAIAFLAWVWTRERRFEAQRAKEGVEGRRIGWRLQFAMRNLLTDYQAAMNRERRRS